LNKIFVTGCAGFIGSNLVDRLIKNKNNYVIGFDNFSTGQHRFIKDALKQSNFSYISGDIIENYDELVYNMQNMDIVYHLAANADVRYGLEHPYKDLEENTIATFHVLEAMRKNNVKKIVFTSTGSIYGETNVHPTPENAPFPVQTSLYGASKLACEGLIEAYCEGYGMQSYIYRLVSVLGERYTHGHLFDFYSYLYMGNSTLVVLGNGLQTKSYVYVQDVIDGILCGIEYSNEKINIFNLGTDETIRVVDSIKWLGEHLKNDIETIYAGGERGWVGDSPFIRLDCQKIRKLGWYPKHTIKESIFATLNYFDKNLWLFKGAKK
jgi:UDP-glucose 4-epimerase